MCNVCLDCEDFDPKRDKSRLSQSNMRFVSNVR